MLLEELHTFPATRREMLDIIASSPSYSAGGTLRCAMPGSTVATCYASTPVPFRRFAHIFFVKGNSDPEADSRPALLVVFVLRRMEKCAHRCFSLPERIALENWTLRPRALRIWEVLVCCPGVA